MEPESLPEDAPVPPTLELLDDDELDHANGGATMVEYALLIIAIM